MSDKSDESDKSDKSDDAKGERPFCKMVSKKEQHHRSDDPWCCTLYCMELG